jgi:hypothetical protein
MISPPPLLTGEVHKNLNLLEVLLSIISLKPVGGLGLVALLVEKPIYALQRPGPMLFYANTLKVYGDDGSNPTAVKDVVTVVPIERQDKPELSQLLYY